MVTTVSAPIDLHGLPSSFHRPALCISATRRWCGCGFLHSITVMLPVRYASACSTGTLCGSWAHASSTSACATIPICAQLRRPAFIVTEYVHGVNLLEYLRMARERRVR